MATPTKCLLFAIFFCLLDASDEFEPHDAHKNVTLNLITKEAKRWYQDFNRTLTRAECVSKPSEHQQQRLYDLWYTGLVCNLWTKFPYDEMEEDFMMTYILIADNPKIFLRMKAEPPNFMNPFRRLYHRSSASLRETLHPLAVAANWDISQYKTLRDQDAFLNVQNKLIEMRSELNQQQTSKLCQIPFVFTSCRRFFDNASLCLDQVTWLKVEVYLTTLGLMLDVEQAAGQHIVNLKSDCIHCIAKMVSIASVNLKQTHKLIHMVTKKAPELTEFFWIQRAHLLQLSSHGRCSNKFEQDPADKLLVKLKRKSVDTFTYTQVMELLESCIYFLKYTALSAFRESSNGKNGNAQTHYFAIQVFVKAIEFAKSVDWRHKSRKRVSKKCLHKLVQYVAEILIWTEDGHGYVDVAKKLQKNYPELEAELDYYIEADINNTLSLSTSCLHANIVLTFDWLTEPV